MQYNLRALLLWLGIAPPAIALAWILRPPYLLDLLQTMVVAWLFSSPIWLLFVFAAYAIGRQDCSTKFLVTFVIVELVSVILIAGTYRVLSYGL